MAGLEVILRGPPGNALGFRHFPTAPAKQHDSAHGNGRKRQGDGGANARGPEVEGPYPRIASAIEGLRHHHGVGVESKTRSDDAQATSPLLHNGRIRGEPLTGEAEVLLSARSKSRIDEKIRELTPRNFGQSLKGCIRCIKMVNAYLLGWIGFFRICTAAEERTLQALDAHIRRRLRALVLRHWKRRRFIARHLISLGVRPKTAWQGVYKGHRSWWALRHTSVVERGLRNANFAERGLVSLAERWKEHHALDFMDPALEPG